MKVLLVDDEIFTIRMLQNLICWQDMGLEISGYAQNGEEAYDRVIAEKPDIVISDIKMPGMNGLEFLGKIKGIHPDIKIILMSAYADFTYIQEGLKLGCSDYILKPVDESEMEHALRRVLLEIQGEKEQKRTIVKSVRQLDKINLYQYMKTGYGLNKVKKHMASKWLEMKNCCVFMVQISSKTIDEYDSSANIEMGQEDYISNILEHVLADLQVEHTIFDFESGCWTILIENIDKLCRENVSKSILHSMKESTGIQVNICFSSVGRDQEEIPGLYKEVKNLSKYSFYIGDKDILGYGYNCDKKELDEVRDIGITRDIDQAVRSKDKEKILSILNETFEISAEYYPEKLRNVYDICYQLLLSVRRQLSVRETGNDCCKDIWVMTYEDLTAIPSMKELKYRMLQMLESLPQLSDKESGKSYSKPVSESIALMEKMYNQNLSLEEISGEIAVSKNYFCYLFKRETGMSIWNYLTLVRLQHAKRLLENTDMRSYEIAFQVGYDNPSYFSKLFKKYENITPNEYRESKKRI